MKIRRVRVIRSKHVYFQTHRKDPQNSQNFWTCNCICYMIRLRTITHLKRSSLGKAETRQRLKALFYDEPVDKQETFDGLLICYVYRYKNLMLFYSSSPSTRAVN